MVAVNFLGCFWYSFLVCVFCKQEPLRSSISSQLRNSLQGLSIANELLEQAVQLVTNDNLDLGCAVIEQAATDKVCFDEEMLLHVYKLCMYILLFLKNLL